jgi:HEAT repeat protein
MVFGLFSKEKSLERTIKRATNKLAQQPDRWGAMEKLKEDGSEAALYGLCRRFGITSHRAIEDEQEKTWVVDTLVEKGAMTLGPLRRYMKDSEQLQLTNALRVLERIVPKPKVLEVVDELLAAEAPGYTRHPDRKLDIIRWLGEWSQITDAELVQRLGPYLADFDENVRFATIEALANRDPQLIGEPLIAALIRPEEESGRIKLRIAEVLAEKKIPLGERAPQVASGLSGTTAGFAVKNGLLAPR